MAKKEDLGTMQCPECGLDGAVVRRQKNGLLYRYCPDCDAQYFPRTQAASDRLAAKIAAPDDGAGVEEAAGINARNEPEREAAPEHEQASERKREKRRAGFEFGL